MHGRTGGATSQVATPAAQNLGQRLSGNARIGQQKAGEASLAFPILLAVGLALYFVWALVEQHEKFREAIRPARIGINLRNIGVILATVLLGVPLVRIGAIKLAAALKGRFGSQHVVNWVELT